MGSDDKIYKRLIALVVSIFVGLATGTPYLYGIYSPQLIQRVGLTISDSATISLAVSVGTGGGGLLGGIIIDHRGPRFSILLGAVFIALGYFGLYRIYLAAFDNVLLICICAVAMGFGSITAYFAALKTAQANFPNHRGTAGIFPVSTYGLSATLFSVIAASYFPNRTGDLLKFLSIFCGITTFIGSGFVKIYNHHDDDDHDVETQHLTDDDFNSYNSVIEEESDIGIHEPSIFVQLEATNTNSYDSNARSVPIKINNPHVHESISNLSSLVGSFSFWGIGTRTPKSSVSSLSSDFIPFLRNIKDNQNQSTSQNQNLSQVDKLDKDTFTRPVLTSRNNSFSSLRNNSFSSLRNNSFSNLKNLPRSSSMNSVNNHYNNALNSSPGNTLLNNSINNSPSRSKASSLNIKPKAKKTPLQIIKRLITNRVFLIHYLLLSLITGAGQTYIYSVGFIAAAQVNHGGDPSKDFTETSSKVQALQVAIISIASFGGRVIAGIFSDLIYKKYHIQRLWVMVITIVISAIGQFLTMINDGNLHLVSVNSALIGGSYGLTFGVYPAIVADFFGTKTFSTTWGLICTGPLFVLFGLNKYFGYVYDTNTNPVSGICYKGNECYRIAIESCLLLYVLMILVNFALIYIHKKQL